MLLTITILWMKGSEHKSFTELLKESDQFYEIFWLYL